jgi:hypothetical protein
VIQIYSRDEVGSAAAKALRADLRDRPAITVVDRVVDVTDADALEAAIANTDKDDAVVFWLKPQSLAALAAKAPPAGQLWFSGVLGAGAAASLPASWVSSAHVVYPYDLPEARAANLSYFKAWLVQRRFPLVDEIWQSEVYFSFSFLTDTVSEMLDNLYRDYLIERAEMMIDRREASRAESEFMSSGTSHVRLHPDPTQESKALARGPEALRAQRSAAGTGFLQRTGTTVYPHLLLGAGQRFASKGAYVAHFSADGRLVADGEWVVP